MEVRGCSQVHYISVIKDGKVIKMHNVARGKSVLKFKNIEQVYDCNGSKCQEPSRRHPTQANRSLAMPDDVYEAKTEVKNEFMEEESELDFGTVTLKQIKKTCKSKKRKSPKAVKIAAVKEEVNHMPCEEDDLELKETLVSWKRKAFKKVKSTTKKTSKCGSTASKINNLCRSLALVDFSGEMYSPLEIKEEYPESDYEQPQAPSSIVSDEPEKVGIVECNSSDKATDVTLGDQYSVQPESVDISNCVLNQVSDEVVEEVGLDTIIPKSSDFEETLMLEGSKVSDQPSVSCALEFFREEDVNVSMTCDESPERVLPKCEPFVIQDNYPHCHAATGEVILETQNVGSSESKDADKHFETINSHSLNHNIITMVDEKELAVADDTSTEMEASNCDNGHIDREDNQISASTNFATSFASTTLVDEEKCSSVDDYLAPLSCSPVIQPSNAIEELTGPEASEVYENKMVSHPPERLFSARKIISPTSQEKLLKAMNVDEHQDDVNILSCKDMLLLEENKLRSSTCQGVKRVRFFSNSKRPEIVNPLKVCTNNRPRKKKAKYGGSPMSQNGGNVCTSVQMCAQNARSFAEIQFHDIKRIAKKLTTGLQSMKSIVVDALQHEIRTGGKFRYNTDEVRVAVEEATKAEEMAQRMLSTMSRDCDRFCKIMRLAEEDARPSEKPKEDNQSSPDTKTVPKERKIMFADEAGGSLCNVKIFNNFETDIDADDKGENYRVDIL